MPIRYPEKFAIQRGPDGGAFRIPLQGVDLVVIASHGGGWDHVSVSIYNRCPTWEEMCFIKDLFFEPEDLVIQYHPPESKQINVFAFCLHLWRPQNEEIPLPPSIFV